MEKWKESWSQNRETKNSKQIIKQKRRRRRKNSPVFVKLYSATVDFRVCLNWQLLLYSVIINLFLQILLHFYHICTKFCYQNISFDGPQVFLYLFCWFERMKSSFKKRPIFSKKSLLLSIRLKVEKLCKPQKANAKV